MKWMKTSRRMALIALVGALPWACSEANSGESATSENLAESTEVAATTNATAAKVEGEVVGQVVDVSCYLAQGLKGDAHRQCAEICANDLGIPLNILDDEGNLWQLVDDDMPGNDQNPTVVQYSEQRVRATGTLIEKGPNKAIIVKNVELVEGTANPRALENSSNPKLGKTFNQKKGMNPCAANPCAAANPCGANPCAGKNPCAANPCAANPCGANPCAANPCGG